jgi:hypothetical protein
MSSLGLSVALLLLAIAGLQLLGVVIDVVRQALDGSLSSPIYPAGCTTLNAAEQHGKDSAVYRVAKAAAEKTR